MAQDDSRKATFRPDAFEVRSLDHAKMVTLTTEFGMKTEERWALETPFLVEDISQALAIQSDSRVLDYGVGPGRMSKGLIEKHGCHAIGIDNSQSMRLLAPEYVLSERFTTWSPELLDKMIAKGFRADFGISLWVIQHVYDPMDVIARIDRALRPDGMLYVLNQMSRCVPTDKGYVSDGFDVPGALASAFIEESRSSLPASVAPVELANQTVIQVLRKRPH